MSSGHKAGLQNYQNFNKSERKIQARKHRDAQRMVDRHGMGETVYRDKDGRKTERTEGIDAATKARAQAEETVKLNQGRVQKEALEAEARELVRLQNSGFARYRDDERLEVELKSEIRKDDPMAQYALSKQRKAKGSSSNTGGGGGCGPPSKPVYKGPPPKPNRFGIRPGYRWDGNDRGNGFEDKVLAKKFSSARKAEESYKYRSADM
jgi:pre-mRNA-splicing factor CWC26